ncbi:butyrophilin-like protein 1 isoform X3 [Cervus elaphus]|uniref:butyrophilin-like protein 1 isoform X3 n=1 Tax=Cervus canadensis TaxID=1574408 RepID=UPI001CA3781E|nr:butyrophilin-like protein 1 isoform X3 [Cervus canadensis]XP_043764697.1 butyrophilin-like protein 1 isoform X3 [Cervus elaphus]
MSWFVKLFTSGEEDPQKKVEALQKKVDVLQNEIDRRKVQFKHAWRNALLYPDWRKEEFRTANVALDAATAHPALLLSEEGK